MIDVTKPVTDVVNNTNEHENKKETVVKPRRVQINRFNHGVSNDSDYDFDEFDEFYNEDGFDL